MTVASASVSAAITRLTGFAADPRRAGTLADRIAPVMAAHGVQGPQDFVTRLKPGADPVLAAAVVDAVVINETLFFRDRAPFETLRNTIMPKLIAGRSERRRLRLWSAACSTGQEAYSLAMLLDENARALAGWSVEIVATDVSSNVLAVARAGIYSHFEVQRGLSTPNLLRYFRRVGAGWEINEAIRAAVSFSERNLLADFRSLGTFDVICCRNVLMYMDVERRKDILDRMAGQLAPDGFLLLGAAETIVGVTDAFAPLPGHPSVFVRSS